MLGPDSWICQQHTVILHLNYCNLQKQVLPIKKYYITVMGDI